MKDSYIVYMEYDIDHVVLIERTENWLKQTNNIELFVNKKTQILLVLYVDIDSESKHFNDCY